MEFTVAAFNAHWGIGRFRHFWRVPYDVVGVVRSFDADIIVVPESWRANDGRGMLDELQSDGYHIETIEFMPLKLRRRNRDSDRDAVPTDGVWELAICSRFPVLARRTYPMGVVAGDPAGLRHALSLTVSIAGTEVEVIGLHTSSKVWRLAPVRHLLALRSVLPRGGPQVLAGDFNFWGPPITTMMRGWDRPVRGRTWPAPEPHSQIDHVLVRGGITGIDGEVLPATPSDHHPIRTRLRLGDGVT